MAIGYRLDPEDGLPYPVCSHHTRADMVPIGMVIEQEIDQERERILKRAAQYANKLIDHLAPEHSEIMRVQLQVLWSIVKDEVTD